MSRVAALSILLLPAVAIAETTPEASSEALAPSGRVAALEYGVDVAVRPSDTFSASTCEAEVELNTTGVPVDVRVSGCDLHLQGAVSRALMRWRWRAAIDGGLAVASTQQLEVALASHLDDAGLPRLVGTWTRPNQVTPPPPGV